ncbi:hypothetical protein VTJ49DRAFT_7281 [Mycothermus thermophilus]|uniref:DUF1765-domain-containing protein n=1 Tax=Humicola insolens TaxID=85995 RepID=A0ABR3VHL6_HUMIN
MSGSRAAVASWAFDSSTSSPLSFPASRSAPDLLYAQPASAPLPAPPQTAASARDAPGSFKSLPPLPGLAAFDIPTFDLVSEFEKSFGLSTTTTTIPGPVEDVPSRTTIPTTTTTATTPIPQAGCPKEDEPTHEHALPPRTPARVTASPSGHARTRNGSMVDSPLSWLSASSRSTTTSVQPDLDNRPKRLVKQHVADLTDAPSPTSGKPADRSRPVDSLTGFAKRSWMSKSRSPSPPGKPAKTRVWTLKSSEKSSRAKAPGSSDSESPSSARGALNRASLYLSRIAQRPQNVFSRSASPSPLKTSSLEENAAVSNDSECSTSISPAVVAKNASYNSVSSATSRASSYQGAASVDSDLDTTDTATASSASENTSSSTVDTTITMPHPTSRDPLWATYRTLDLEFTDFAAKGSTAGRMLAVRSVLLPFLRSTAYHPSNSNLAILAPEDVDRRATILNRWWIGLLAMLAGAGPRLPPGLVQGVAALGVAFPTLQPVAGVDRPTLLEAATLIMTRPEWRACTSQFRPLAERCPDERVRPRSGTQSTVDTYDTDSLLLAESAEHHVRTMFVTNLTTQMALVVDKLSVRHAPVSLVNWSGRACAYAFFFVPGVADVLVRLWGLSADLLRRVADEFGLPRRSRGESDDIVALFPTHLHKLGWSSVKSLGDKLRIATKLPLMLAKIHWHGPWVSRWHGGDTDLVFIFCKYFYILAQDFMPDGLPLVEKARAPAFVLVHAQLLSILDSTIHRQASLDAMLGPPLPDGSYGDAALTAPQLPSNLLKGMDENRLILLLKDVLAEDSYGITDDIRHTFAEAIVAIAKAATKRTPRFEHASCFMLCDFLEEALVALDAFQHSVSSGLARPVDYIDWPFWFDVGKMIMDSNNTMSEIRILSFFFSVWDIIVADPVRKEALCLDWLLSEAVFARFFNHWCPMVRAYYMRLLCWRICRDSGSANEMDTKIFLVVSQRLKTVWSHYLWLKQDAEAKGRMLPSTAPVLPAPGKRFLILRTDVPPAPPAMKLGFDSMSSAFQGLDAPFEYHSPAAAGNAESLSDDGDKVDGNGLSFKKRLSLLGKVLPFSSSNETPASSDLKRWEQELEQARRETAQARLSKSSSTKPPSPSARHLLGPPPPPKDTVKRPSPSSSVGSSSDSFSSSTSSSTTGFDGPSYIFRFILSWQIGPGGLPMPFAPMRDRILTRPRLPGPAQARVSARLAGLASATGSPEPNGIPLFRSDSPPPIAPGLPPDTRRVSGLLQTGLISEARNARPLSVKEDGLRRPAPAKDADRRMSFSGAGSERCMSLSGVRGERTMPFPSAGGERCMSLSGVRGEPPLLRGGWQGQEGGAGDIRHSLDLHSPTVAARDRSFDVSRGAGSTPLFMPAPMRTTASPPPFSPPPPTVRAERPTGVYAQGAVYAGRALAEWSMVVSECNGFVDRRRDEGVLGLSEVEVPTLGVEGLGVRARG